MPAISNWTPDKIGISKFFVKIVFIVKIKYCLYVRNYVLMHNRWFWDYLIQGSKFFFLLFCQNGVMRNEHLITG